ncbi:hypothetical protein FIBSPDRAFT_790399, partial [Athelia psychrophila]
MSGLGSLLDEYTKNPRSPYIMYAQNVINGVYGGSSGDVFVQLLAAVASANDKEARGVGLQGFRYGPALQDFAHVIAIQSTRAYQAVRKILPLPTVRTLQKHRAAEGHFPFGVNPKCITRVVEHLQKLNWKGPVSLACDDTKLTPAFRPYHDTADNKHYLIGSTGEPLLLADPEDFRALLNSGKLVKSTKLRLLVIVIPVPGLPTIIFSGFGISDSLKAEDLLEFLKTLLLNGLLAHKVPVCNYAADGAGTERKAQMLLTQLARATHTLRFPHPGKSQTELCFDIPLFGDQLQPVVMIQDSKHCGKTIRNNAFTGARLLILGNYVVHYHQFRAIAFENGPLYRRDVEKTDRQDDAAATRLGAAATLEWLITKQCPDFLGPSVYLFVLYELIDAYQSRTMKHIDRVQLVFRAKFFMEMWADFLDAAGYSQSKHFVSSQARDIIRSLTDGLIQLIVVYRDFSGGVFPLLPWLLSTEACEHIFGLCRQIQKDFTELDWNYMVSKLHIRLREHFLFKDFSDGKGRAGGYDHTYTDSRGVDLSSLAIFPSNAEIADRMEIGYAEAHSIWTLLGWSPTPGSQKAFAPVSTWFKSQSGEANNGSDVDKYDDEKDWDDEEDDEEVSDS